MLDAERFGDAKRVVNKYQSVAIDLRSLSLNEDERRAYCQGIAHGIRMSPLMVDAIRGRANVARLEYPDAVVCEVTVYDVDVERSFTWDEFDAWCAG